jgi:hypothetical protein
MIVEALQRLHRPKETEEEQERNILATQLAETRWEIHRTYLQFNSTDDPDLIEAAVYEINAYQARYSYLLRRLKALESRKEAFPTE